MSGPPPRERSLALNVEAIRRSLLEGVRLPPDLVNEALAVTKAKLSARKTLFFSHRGRVVDKVDIEDHSTQLAAADQVLKLTDLYVRERGLTPATPNVALEIDQETGVVRLVVGRPTPAIETPPVPEPALSEPTEPQIVRRGRHIIPDAVARILECDDDDNG